MKLYLNQKNKVIDATAEYDPVTKTFIVLKGSIVSENITNSKTFHGAKSIEKARGNGVVMDRTITRDIIFKSASTAANFVTGVSMNGLTAWKEEKGKTLKAILREEENYE